MLHPDAWEKIKRRQRPVFTSAGNLAFAGAVIAGGVLCGFIGRTWGWGADASFTPAVVMLGAVLLGGALRFILREK